MNEDHVVDIKSNENLIESDFDDGFSTDTFDDSDNSFDTSDDSLDKLIPDEDDDEGGYF